MFKLTIYFVQAIIIYLFFLIGRIFGIKIGRKFFSLIFLLFGPFLKSKNIINKNLDIFSLHKKDIDKISKVNEMWKNYEMTFIEYVYLNNLRKKNDHIKIIGEENLTGVIKEKKPAIFVSGHFANFEMMSMEITKKKIELATIYRPLNNIFLNPFMEFLRKKYVCSNQIKKGINGVREAINFIKNKHSVALMIDQRVSEGEQIDFFGKKAFTTTLPAQLSLKFSLDIIPVFIKRTKDNNFIIEFQKPLKGKNFKDKTDITKQLNKILERMVSRNPGQWIWTHNRWK